MAYNRFNYGLPAQINSDFGPEDAVSAQLMEDPNNQKRRLLPRALAGSSLTNNAAAMANLSARAERAITEGLDLYKQPDDYRAAEEFGRQRAQQGEADMLNAFAAQIAPKRFAPLGEAFLKKALAAQEPVKVGSATIGADGQIIRDPSAERLKQAESQLKLGEFLTGQVNNMRDDEGRQIQRDFMNSLAIDRANKPTDPSGGYRIEDGMRREYEGLTADLRNTLNATGNITTIIESYVGQTIPSVDQSAIITLLNKFLDPTSVVREAEYDRIFKAQGIEAQIRNMKNKFATGQPLDQATIDQINNLSKIYNKAATSKLQIYGKQYRDTAIRRNLNPDSVVGDIGAGSDNIPASALAMGVTQEQWSHMTPDQRKAF